MKRVSVLSLFLIRNLLRSLLGLVPLATMLGAYTITFFYQGQKVDYFASVGGFDLAILLPLLAAGLLFLLAVWLFRRRDLLWTE